VIGVSAWLYHQYPEPVDRAVDTVIEWFAPKHNVESELEAAAAAVTTTSATSSSPFVAASAVTSKRQNCKKCIISIDNKKIVLNRSLVNEDEEEDYTH